ncbi:DUF820 [Desulfonema limicola]|uniref:DUF820 n=1 Tax=Desulfonema limicola TaxID=45656 RepID=A0A975B823_9BACT|nr:Uma2 family endonuclease [Desulfonema limicola]QTA80423.1 DUF820 [Desulfonema limicola]
MQEKAIEWISEQEYLEYEKDSEIKYEYFEGEMFAMAGASEKHNLIVSNLIMSLGNQLKQKPCRVYPSGMRLKIEHTGLYTYPDVMIVCGERKFTNDDKPETLLNPDVIIEVLLDSTESYDRGRKFEHYRKLESLKEYVLVSQDVKKIEKYFKADGKWIFSDTDENNTSIVLESLDCELNHLEIYDKID